MAAREPDLFGQPSEKPEGFKYAANLIGAGEEQQLLGEIKRLPFVAFQFHGYKGKRRVLSFGWRYDFNGGGLQKAGDIPAFLLPVRSKAAAFAGLHESKLQHVLLTEYPAGATIGWHKDRSAFGEVIGVSLLSACTFRLRRKTGMSWSRVSVIAEPCSAYLLRGEARTEWEHSIPAVDSLRYSITFRTLQR